jgi:septal ring factor EnvC (AmiA/AmiB activator)
MFFEVLVSLLGENGVAIHDVNVTETGEVKIDIDFSEYNKPFKDKIKSLQEECAKLYKQLMETEKDMQEETIVLSKQIADLQCELADKEDKEDKKCDCKSKKIAVVVAERING